MLKEYCNHCGKANIYSFEKPTGCRFCGKPIQEAKASQINSPPSQSAPQRSPQPSVVIDESDYFDYDKMTDAYDRAKDRGRQRAKTISNAFTIDEKEAPTLTFEQVVHQKKSADRLPQRAGQKGESQEIFKQQFKSVKKNEPIDID